MFGSDINQNPYRPPLRCGLKLNVLYCPFRVLTPIAAPITENQRSGLLHRIG